MQWSGEPAGGFTTADEPVRPLVETGPFGFPRTNVERQRRDPGSLLNWMERLIRRRRECPELGCGDWALLEQEDRAVFAHRADWDGSTIVAVHNLAGRGARRRCASTPRASWSTCSARRACGSTASSPSPSSPTTSAGSGCAGPGSGSRRERQPWCVAQYASRAALPPSSGG